MNKKEKILKDLKMKYDQLVEKMVWLNSILMIVSGRSRI